MNTFNVMRFTILFLISFCTFHCANAQSEAIIIRGKVVDETGVLLPYARIINQQSKVTTLTNQRGIFYISVFNPQVSLKISYIGYTLIDTLISIENMNTDTIDCFFRMTPKSNELAMITVSSKPYHQVFETTNLNIIDYTFFGQNILLLVSNKGDYQVRLMDPSEKILTKQNLSFKPRGFLKDCLGILHLFSKDSLYPVHFDSEIFSFPDAIPIEDYIEFIEPCVASTEDYFALQNISDFNQTIEYIAQRKKDDFYSLIRKITDSEKVEDVLRYASELEMAHAPSMTSEIFDERDIRAAREKFQDQVFFDLVVTNAAYSPLIKTSSAIFVFDHYSDSCYVFNHHCHPLRTLYIQYHKRSDWAEKLILEEGSERIFAIHNNLGIYSISEINLETGELKYSVRLSEHTYPQKIKIRNGWIFYLYQDMLTPGFTKLFKVPVAQ